MSLGSISSLSPFRSIAIPRGGKKQPLPRAGSIRFGAKPSRACHWPEAPFTMAVALPDMEPESGSRLGPLSLNHDGSMRGRPLWFVVVFFVTHYIGLEVTGLERISVACYNCFLVFWGCVCVFRESQNRHDVLPPHRPPKIDMMPLALWHMHHPGKELHPMFKSHTLKGPPKCK